MISRRSILRAAAGAAAATTLAGLGCAPGALLAEVRASRSEIVPDGTGLHDEADIAFRLTRRAEVSANLFGPDARQYVLRPPQLRAPDRYQIAFRGIVDVPETNWKRVIPDGTYRIVLSARDERGISATKEIPITVTGADTTPPELTEVFVNPKTFTPDGDGRDDVVRVSYRLTKESQVKVYVTDAAGSFYLIQAQQKLRAALQSFEWDGTAAGGAVLPDGRYTLHLEAVDLAGNFTDLTETVEIANGGTPRAEITNAKFTPVALAVGMDLQVSITVKNTGTVPLHTLGPPPGTPYTTSMNYASFPDPQKPDTPRWYERAGVWRVCVGWQNAPQAYPVRWGFFEDESRVLAPGESVTVDGTIKILTTAQHSIIFYAGLEQGAVGFPGGQVGFKTITVSNPNA